MENKELIENNKVIKYIWGEITPMKRVFNKEDIPEDAIKKVAKKINGTICYEYLPKVNIDAMEEIALVVKTNNITIEDLVLKRYYLLPIGGKYQIYKKYTSIVADFKKDNPNLMVNFEVMENGVKCNIVDINTNMVVASNYCGVNEVIKTNRPKFDFLRAKAFKDLMRYNYPKYIGIYDEIDYDIMKEEKRIEKLEKKNNNKDIMELKEAFKGVLNE